MWPSCLSNDCETWGPKKLNDSKLTGVRSLGMTYVAANPYIQLDLGVGRTDITAVRITSRADCCLQQSQNLNVYLSATTAFLPPAGMLASAGITFSAQGQTVTILTPVNITARYLTVWKNDTWQYLSLQEVTALYDGAWGSVLSLCGRAGACT